MGREGKGRNPPANANAKHKQSVDFGPVRGRGEGGGGGEQQQQGGGGERKRRRILVAERTHIWYTKRDLGPAFPRYLRRFSLRKRPILDGRNAGSGPRPPPVASPPPGRLRGARFRPGL